MEWLTGTGLAEFLGVTLALFGGAGFLMGQALAHTWRPAWQAVPYAFLMAAGNRFLSYALFEGKLFAVAPYVFDVAIVLGLASSLGSIIPLLAFNTSDAATVEVWCVCDVVGPAACGGLYPRLVCSCLCFCFTASADNAA